jgi:hypothetical protein
MTNQLQEKMLVGYYKSLILILFFATILCSCETSSDQLQSESFDLKISKCSPLQIDLSYNFNNSTGFSQSNIDGEKIVSSRRKLTCCFSGRNSLVVSKIRLGWHK